MDNDFSADLRELATTVMTNDVVIMRFVTVGDRLLLDFRTSDVDGPMVRLVAPVKSARERFANLRQLRPRFAPPEHIVAVAWPGFARSLAESEAWKAVMERLADTAHVESVRHASKTLRALIELEAGRQKDAVRGGEGFRTLWSARAAQA